jgi:hypothetical protein
MAQLLLGRSGCPTSDLSTNKVIFTKYGTGNERALGRYFVTAKKYYVMGNTHRVSQQKLVAIRKYTWF